MGNVLRPHFPTQFFALKLQLAMQFPPFAQAQETEELLVRPFAQLRLGQVFVRLAIGLPELEDADEFGLGIRELRMRGIGGSARIRGAFARILDA